jgi:pimeloyl-ACP methyl ester carboxylesterase
VGARFVHANGLRFAYLTSGPADGPLALCLHGFPDTPATWRHLLPQLAQAGFRAVAPWLRGYAPTEVPQSGITPGVLAGDVNGLHEALGGREDAVLVGHDWGAIAANRAAADAPARWRRLVTLAVPPDRFVAGGWRDPAQVLRSRYIVAAALPGAPRRIDPDDLTWIRRLWRRWSPAYEPGPEDLEPLRASLRSPGVAQAMQGYYRGLIAAMLTGRAMARPMPLPPQPHLVLHGRDDGCVGAAFAARARGRLPHPQSRVVLLEGCGHWLHLEVPDVVGQLVIDHLRDRP